MPIILSSNIMTEEDLIRVLKLKNTSKDFLISKITNELLKEIGVSRQTLSNMSNYDLLKILYFGPKKKPEICTDLYKYYKSINRLVIDIK